MSSNGSFGKKPNKGSFGKKPSNGSFGKKPSKGSFGKKPSKGGFGSKPSNGSFGKNKGINTATSKPYTFKKSEQVKAQAVFNRFVRDRDREKPCISCGQKLTHEYSQAGHYISVGRSKALRFHEDNVHSQCSYCNIQLEGNVSKYRAGLIKKIGIEKVEKIEEEANKSDLKIPKAEEIFEKYKKFL